MSDISWDRLTKVCDDISELPPDEQAGALERLARTAPDLADEVRSLLATDRPLSIDLPDAPGARHHDPVSDGTHPASLPPIERIGRYLVDAPLGSGASATVYRARTLVPPRDVAIKLFHTPIGTGASEHEWAAARRFDAEVRALTRLRHPGIATIFDAGSSTIESVDRRWIVMELVDGGPLTTWASGCEADRRTCVRLAADLAAAVSHAHARGIIHRDLKPGNVLVEMRDGRPVVRILDFGVARLLDDGEAMTRVTGGGQVIGTVGYLAPEQVLGDPEAISTSVDVYAMGLILHELLTGTPAIDVPTGPLVSRLHAVARARPRDIRSIPGGIDEDLAVIVEKATAREIDDRYGSAAAFEEDLRRYLDGRPILARPLSAFEIGRRFVRRHWIASGLTLAASIVLPTLLIVTVASLQRVRASNTRTTQALIRSLDVANAMADAMDRQYGGSAFIDEYYQRQFETVAAIVPTVAAGAMIDDPFLVDAIERHDPPGWRVTRRDAHRIAVLDREAEGGSAGRIPRELRERYGEALLRYSAALTQAKDNLGSLELRLIGLALEQESLEWDPAAAEHRRHHAYATVLVGDSLLHLGDADAALELYWRALAEDRALARDFPEVIRHLDDVAWGLDRIAAIKIRDDPEAARALLLERLAICEDLVARTDRQRDGRAWGHALHGCAVSCHSLGLIAERLGDEDPTPWYDRSEDGYQRLAVAYPDDFFYADRYVDISTKRIRRLIDAGAGTEEVLVACDELLALCGAFLDAGPQWDESRRRLARTHTFSARTAIERSRWDRAHEDVAAMVRWLAPVAGGPPDPGQLTRHWTSIVLWTVEHWDDARASESGVALALRARGELEALVRELEQRAERGPRGGGEAETLIRAQEQLARAAVFSGRAETVATTSDPVAGGDREAVRAP